MEIKTLGIYLDVRLEDLVEESLDAGEDKGCDQQDVGEVEGELACKIELILVTSGKYNWSIHNVEIINTTHQERCACKMF